MKIKNKTTDTKEVRSVNKNIRSSNRKLKPILKSIVGKKVDLVIRDLSFSDKRISKDINIGLSFLVLDLIFLFTDLTSLVSVVLFLIFIFIF